MFNITTLPSGLRVSSLYMNGFGSACITILIKTGGRYEGVEEQGIAHFLEHMSFKGTKLRNYKQIAQQFDDIGGRFDASTGKETTIYYVKVLADQINIALDLLADILINSTFDGQEIEKEKMVVMEEIAGFEDDYESLNYDNFFNQAFKNQSMGRSILGTKKTLSSFNAQALKNYTQKYYAANNIIISVAGNVQHDYLIQLVEKYFRDLPQQKSLLPELAYYKSGIALLDKKKSQTNIILGFPSTSYKDIDAFYKTDIIASILGRGISSRLFQNIREKLGLAYSVGSNFSAYSDIGLFYLYGSSISENYFELLDKMYIEIKQLCSFISDEEIKRAKNQIRIDLIMNEESADNQSDIIANEIACLGQRLTSAEVLKTVDSFSKKDLLAQTEKIFSAKPVFTAVGKGISMDYDKIDNKISTPLI